MPLSVNCPECGEQLEVDREYRTWQVRCPHCRFEFIPDRVLPPESTPARPASRRRPRRLSDDEVVDRALQIVAGPASWLRVLGGLIVFFGLLGIGTAIAMGVWVEGNPQNAGPNADETIANLIVLGVVSVFGILCGGFTMYGAMKLGRLESQGWGTATGVVAISSVIFCGLCGMVTLMPLGIWVLVTINKSEVKEGFEVVARRRAGRIRYDDEDEDEDE